MSKPVTYIESRSDGIKKKGEKTEIDKIVFTYDNNRNVWLSEIDNTYSYILIYLEDTENWKPYWLNITPSEIIYSDDYSYMYKKIHVQYFDNNIVEIVFEDNPRDAGETYVKVNAKNYLKYHNCQIMEELTNLEKQLKM